MLMTKVFDMACIHSVFMCFGDFKFPMDTGRKESELRTIKPRQINC